MNTYINLIVNSIKRKGFVETIVHLIKNIFVKLFSIIKITYLKMRNYDIDYSVLLRGNNFFFQSTKSAIKISKNTIIGKFTRISGGSNGKIYIGESVLIDDHTFIMAHEKIAVGKFTKIAAFCFITDFNHIYTNKKLNLVDQGYSTNPVIIGDHVWIGTHVIILPGVKVGNRSVIGAGSVVTKDIPANSVAVGNPAKVIKKI